MADINKIWYLAFMLILVFLLFFGIAEWLQIPLLTDMSYLEGEAGAGVAAVSVALLVGDLILPIPASIIMIGNGAVFGTLTGAFLSLTGGVLSSVIGYYLGAKSKRIVTRFISDREFEKSDLFLKKWGMMAIVITRPIPLVSETFIIIAGMTGFDQRKMFLGSLLGIAPASFIYALIGANFLNAEFSMYSFLFVIGIAGALWFIGRIWNRNNNQTDATI